MAKSWAVSGKFHRGQGLHRVCTRFKISDRKKICLASSQNESQGRQPCSKKGTSLSTAWNRRQATLRPQKSDHTLLLERKHLSTAVAPDQLWKRNQSHSTLPRHSEHRPHTSTAIAHLFLGRSWRLLSHLSTHRSRAALQPTWCQELSTFSVPVSSTLTLPDQPFSWAAWGSFQPLAASGPPPQVPSRAAGMWIFKRPYTSAGKSILLAFYL